jgi:hypothetical protein
MSDTKHIEATATPVASPPPRLEEWIIYIHYGHGWEIAEVRQNETDATATAKRYAADNPYVRVVHVTDRPRKERK